MHTEASDFLGGLRPVRRTSEEVCAVVLLQYMMLVKTVQLALHIYFTIHVKTV